MDPPHDCRECRWRPVWLSQSSECTWAGWSRTGMTVGLLLLITTTTTTNNNNNNNNRFLSFLKHTTGQKVWHVHIIYKNRKSNQNPEISPHPLLVWPHYWLEDTISRIRWYLMSMLCLDRWWWTGFSASWRADLLSIWTQVGRVRSSPRSLSS
jgi:hypothetical protein